GNTTLYLHGSTMTVGGSFINNQTGSTPICYASTATVNFTSTVPGRIIQTSTVGSATAGTCPIGKVNFIGVGGGWTLGSAMHMSTITVASGATFSLQGSSLTVSSWTNAGNVVIVGTETTTTRPLNIAGSTITYNSTGSSIILSTWVYRNL